VPIILLTALGDVAARITGLQLGADDSMVKPFSPKELEARIRCVLRRAGSSATDGLGGSGRGAHVVVVDVHISRLRAKLEQDPENPDRILTARGEGYLFQRIQPPLAAST
jgi:OmpR family response regulator RpaB